ncbi:MAG: hypothetical protein HY654_01910 [Acidobacteria bacterium]|nr:hypothetical protein [Acidobacteriota bacterium]
MLEVSNDPNWLLLRLEPFAGASTPTYGDPDRRDRRLAELAPVFIDRVVLFVDGHEVRPVAAEYVPPGAGSGSGDIPPLGTYRLRGHMPSDARSLRWFYGLVIDPYPMTIEHADGSTSALLIAGEAWSATIDLSGQFRAPRRWDGALVLAIVIAFLGFFWYRWRERRRFRDLVIS